MIPRRPRPRSLFATAIAGAAVVATASTYALASPAQMPLAAHAGASPAARVAPAAPRGSSFSLANFKHVWIIVLENESESSTFGSPTFDPYLATTLRKKALFLKNYYATGHNSLDNYISLTSGQAPNVNTQEDCQVYMQFPGDTYVATPGEPQQQQGDGCVYPSAVNDIGNQLSAKHKSWAGYMEDMGNDTARDNPDHGTAACGHPTINTHDQTQGAENGDGYAARHDPFVYYEAVTNDDAFCSAHVVAQGTPSGAMPAAAIPGEHGLAYSLSAASHTPAYSFITPNLCDDGHDYPCKTGQKSLGSAGLDIDRWLKLWVPKILHSSAYQKNGLLEITFDESHGDDSACCNEATDPNATPGGPGVNGPGGGKVGALLFSPFLKAGKTSKLPFNHYSTLATDESIFSLSKLGYAGSAQTFIKAIKADLK